MNKDFEILSKRQTSLIDIINRLTAATACCNKDKNKYANLIKVYQFVISNIRGNAYSFLMPIDADKCEKNSNYFLIKYNMVEKVARMIYTKLAEFISECYNIINREGQLDDKILKFALEFEKFLNDNGMFMFKVNSGMELSHTAYSYINAIKKINRYEASGPKKCISIVVSSGLGCYDTKMKRVILPAPVILDSKLVDNDEIKFNFDENIVFQSFGDN